MYSCLNVRSFRAPRPCQPRYMSVSCVQIRWLSSNNMHGSHMNALSTIDSRARAAVEAMRRVIVARHLDIQTLTAASARRQFCRHTERPIFVGRQQDNDVIQHVMHWTATTMVTCAQNDRPMKLDHTVQLSKCSSAPDTWWTCCKCGHTVSPCLTTYPDRCPLCGHFECSACGSYS